MKAELKFFARLFLKKDDDEQKNYIREQKLKNIEKLMKVE